MLEFYVDSSDEADYVLF